MTENHLKLSEVAAGSQECLHSLQEGSFKGAPWSGVNETGSEAVDTNAKTVLFELAVYGF